MQLRLQPGGVTNRPERVVGANHVAIATHLGSHIAQVQAVRPLDVLIAKGITEHRKKLALSFLLIALLALAAHGGTVLNGFAFDDRGAILDNPTVHAALNVHELLTTDYWGGHPPNWRIGLWRPLAALTLWIDQQLGGGMPWMFHLTNVFWHIVASLALAMAVYRQSGRLRLALLTGATFAVLAINSEAVAGIVSRADVMAAALGFTAWAAVAPLAGSLTTGQLATFGVALFAALLCKETAVIAGGWLAAWCAFLYVDDPSRRARETLFQLILIIAAVLLVYVGLRESLVAPLALIKRDFLNNPLLHEALLPRLWTGAAILSLIFERSILPVRLIPDYSFAGLTAARTPFAPSVIGGLVLIALLLSSAWYARRRDPMWSFGVLIALVGWFALSNIPVPLPIVFAERLLYGTTAGIALLFGVASDHLFARRAWTAGIVVALVVSGNLVRTITRERDWHDDRRLFTQATLDAPNVARAWNNLGATLMEDKRYVDALHALDRATAIAPDWSPPYTLRGITLSMLDRRSEAEASLRRAYALDPDDAQAAYNLAVILGQWGHREEAVAVLRQFVSSHPSSTRERDLLANVNEH